MRHIVRNLSQDALAIFERAEAESRNLTDSELAEIQRIDRECGRMERIRPRRLTETSLGDGFGMMTGGAGHDWGDERLPIGSGFRNEREGFFCGQWLLANVFGKPRAKEWLSRNQMHFAQSEGINTAGGALVPSPLATTIINLVETYGIFRQAVGVTPMGSDTLIIPRAVGGLTATITSENTALTEGDQVFDNVQLSAKKIGVITRASTELAEDAVINIANWLAQQMARAFARKEDEIGFTGAGGATHGHIQGLTSKFEADLTLVGSVDAASGNDTFAEFTMADFHSVMAVLPSFATPTARWYCSPQFFHGTMMRLAAASAGNTFANFSAGMGLNWLGFPVVLTSVLPSGTPTTDYSDDVVCLFGDLSLACTMGERRGITVATSGDRYFELDQIAIKCTERVDIVVHDIGDTTTAGPVVALVGE